MKYVLAYDIGTSGNKATLFDTNGRLVATEVFSYGVLYYNGNWAEQDPEDWWHSVCVNTKNLISKSNISPKSIAAVSFSGQMMGCVCVNKHGDVLRNAIIWADQRSQKQTEQIANKISQLDFYRITGHRNMPCYGLQKLMWIKDNEPDIYKKIYKVLNAKDFIIHRLTGNFLTEPSDASGMTCFELNSHEWSEKLVNIAGIDGEMLPTVVPSTHIAGEVTPKAALQTGLGVGTPVVMGGGDGVCASIGAGSVKKGGAYICIGTSAWVSYTSDEPVFDDRMRTVTWAHIIPGMYAPCGAMQCAGSSYSWLKSQIALYENEEAADRNVSQYLLMDDLAETSPFCANGIIFLPYLLGERAPRWNPNLRGTFLGIKQENTRGDIIRSVLEGVAMNLAAITDVFREHMKIDEMTIIGGGAKGQTWRQIIAEACNARLLVPNLLEESTSMGAAITAGVGVGVFNSFDCISNFIEINNRVEPSIDAVLAYETQRQWFDLFCVAIEPIYDLIAKHRSDLC